MVRIRPRTADGRAFIESLRGTPRFFELRSHYRRAATAQSCMGDLREAAEMVSALHELLSSPRKEGTKGRRATEAALLATAVQLYARATHTAAKKGERGAIDIRDGLTTDQQREDHRALVDARVKAMAHVYPDEPIAGTMWHRSELVLVENDRGWRAAWASQRIQLDNLTLARLNRQLPVADGIVMSKFYERTGAFSRVVNEIGVPMATFEAVLIDLDTAIGPGPATALIESEGDGFTAFFG